MNIPRLRSSVICIISLNVILSVFTGCVSANLSGFSSTADREQKATSLRTEMFLIKGDDPKMSRDYAVVSAVDYNSDGKKVYYLMIVPSRGSGSDMKMEDLKFQNEYPYIIQSQFLPDLISNLDKCASEWDGVNVKYSGAVYNFFISSPNNAKPYLEIKTRWYEEKRFYEIYPYIKFNFTRDEKASKAAFALGNRVEQIIYTGPDGKTVRGRSTVQDEEKVWTFDTAARLRDFQIMLSKGYMDLKSRGMEGYSRKFEIRQEIKEEKKPEKIEEKRDEEKQAAEKKVKKTKKKKAKETPR